MQQRALSQEGGMEADVARIFDQQALPRLDQQTCEQSQDLLDAAGDQHVLGLAAHGARAAQPGGNGRARFIWAEQGIPLSGLEGMLARFRQTPGATVGGIGPADHLAPACPGKSVRRAGAGAEVEWGRRRIAGTVEGDGGDAAGPCAESDRRFRRSTHAIHGSLHSMCFGLSGFLGFGFDGWAGLTEDGGDVGAGADTPIDVALGAQPFVGRRDGEPRDAKLFGEVARGRQPVAGTQPPAQDGGAQPSVDLLRQAVGGVAPPVERQQEVNSALVHDWPYDIVQDWLLCHAIPCLYDTTRCARKTTSLHERAESAGARRSRYERRAATAGGGGDEREPGSRDGGEPAGTRWQRALTHPPAPRADARR